MNSNQEEQTTIRDASSGLVGENGEETPQAVGHDINGDRSETMLHGLDEEDTIIVSAVLDGIQNPNTLPDLNARPKASEAAPGLASIIHAAGSGDAGALNALSVMAQQMTQTGGAMAEIAGAMRKLVNGERDFDVLSKKMRQESKDLLIAILNELGKLSAQ